MLHRSLLTLLVSATVALPAAAQRTEVYHLTPDASVPRAAWGSVTVSRRAVIGVTVNMRPSATDSQGAAVTAVTPGGPAAKAGILAGDIITKFNGTALVVRGQQVQDDEQSAPGLRLVELVSRVEPGDTIAVEWRHERQRKTARVVTQPAGNVWVSGDSGYRIYSFSTPGAMYGVGPDGMMERERALTELRGRVEMLPSPAPMAPLAADRVFLRMGGPLGGVQFAPINPDLGRYFGVTEGILILDTPDSSVHVDLKGGDVIVGVDGRKATDVDQLMRILGSYNDGETINFDVMRDKRRIAVAVKAEELRSGTRFKVALPPGRPDGIRTPVPDMPPPASAPRSRSRSGT